MIRSIHREDIIILNVYVSSDRTSKSVTDRIESSRKSMIITGDFNTPRILL